MRPVMTLAVVRPCGPVRGNAYLVSGTRFLSRDRVCRGGVARGGFGGISPWFLPACTDATSQPSRAVSSFEDRRRAGRWDREQLIEGKAIELVSKALRVPLGV